MKIKYTKVKKSKVSVIKGLKLMNVSIVPYAHN